MKKTNFAVLVICLSFMLVGLGGGYVIASRLSERAPAAKDADHADLMHGHAHGPNGEHLTASAPGGAPANLSPQALKNLGVTVADIEERPYSKYQSVTASVVEAPTSQRPIFAPVGGRITKILITPGALVKGGDVVMEILRDPIPRPTLALTEEILKPVNEELHRAVADMNKARRNVEILKAEIERIAKFSEGSNDNLPLLPRKGLYDLRNELARAEQEVANTRAEFARHGFSEAQIADVEAGKHVVHGPETWQGVLAHNHMWPRSARTLFKALPEGAQGTPLMVKVVAELSAAGLATEELSAWLAATPDAAQYFMEIASLLQQGNTLQTIQLLHQTTALQPIVQIRAPVHAQAPDWDVHELLVQATEKVEAGKKLATFENSRQMLLKATPVGGEIALVLNALKANQELEAVPATADAGPVLKGLKIEYMRDEETGHGSVAFVKALNQPLHVRGDEAKFRSWSLRAGQKYFLRVPTTKIDAAFVLPADAVTEDGPDKVVFIKSGDKFKPAKVVILHQDHESVVLDTKHSELFPGDPVVQHGAFGLGLALKLGSGQPISDCCGRPHVPGEKHEHKH